MRQKLILNKPEFVMAWRLWQFGFALPRIVAGIKGLRIDMKKAPATRNGQRGAPEKNNIISIADMKEDVNDG